MRVLALGCLSLAAATVLVAGRSSAQEPRELPPLPPPNTSPVPPQPPSPEPAPPPYAPPDDTPPENPAPVPAPYPTPPPPSSETYRESEPVRAPKFSLWLGGRLGFLTYGGSFYGNELGSAETTGNYITNGAALQLDIGARLGRRYIPYVGFELGLVGAGHRFDGGPSTSAQTRFYGIGFRYTGGDVDSAGFLTDISIGIRQIEVSNETGTYTMSAFEVLRLGLGAEIRLTHRFVISPMLTFSGGVIRDTDGAISFGPGQGDGISAPLFRNGAVVDSGYSETYLTLTFGMGAHFDLIGK